MSNAYLSPVFQDCQVNDDNTFLAGGLIWFYQAGTTTPTLSYTTPNANVAWSNPIQLNARGETGGDIWLLAGTAYKIILESKPEYGQTHGIVITEFDNITGVNDPSASQTSSANWISFAGTPTYISSTSFSVTGDNRATFLTSRRVKISNSDSSVTYATVVSSSYATGITTIVVSPDYGNTVSSLMSSVSYGFIETGAVSSIPIAVQAGSAASGSGGVIWIDYDSSIGLRWAINSGALSSNWPINAATASAANNNSFATQQTSSQGIISVRRSTVNDISLVNDATSWGLLEQNIGYAVQYNRSTSKYSYGGFTLPTPGVSSNYIKLPNGLIMQFGQATATSGGSTVTFPTAFPNYCLQVVTTPVNATSTATSVDNLTVTSFTAKCASTSPVSYIAIGY